MFESLSLEVFKKKKKEQKKNSCIVHPTPELLISELHCVLWHPGPYRRQHSGPKGEVDPWQRRRKRRRRSKVTNVHVQ